MEAHRLRQNSACSVEVGKPGGDRRHREAQWQRGGELQPVHRAVIDIRKHQCRTFVCPFMGSTPHVGRHILDRVSREQAARWLPPPS